MPLRPWCRWRTDTQNLKIALTGGIACGKSLLSRYLSKRGFEILDADAVVHEIIPDPAERRRIAAKVFSDPEERRKLESRLHPMVRERIDRWFSEPSADKKTKIAAIPLLFEVHWDEDYDIILCVVSSKEKQIERMTATRGYSVREAVARIEAQMDLRKKAERSHYVIHNDSSEGDLEAQAERFIAWLNEQPGR